MRHVALIALLSCLGLCAPRAAAAQETVFYRCTDAQGNTSLQNGTPCAPGMKQEIRRIGEVRTVPVPEKKPAAEAPPAEQPQYGEFVLVSGPNMQRKPAPAAAVLPPPPPLYQCRSWDGKTYFGETDAPEPRCVPLQVQGIDGGEVPGAVMACEMKQDACEAIPADGLCEAWLRHLDEADFRVRYARADNLRERRAAFAAIEAKVKASRCSPDPPAPGKP